MMCRKCGGDHRPGPCKGGLPTVTKPASCEDVGLDDPLPEDPKIAALRADGWADYEGQTYAAFCQSCNNAAGLMVRGEEVVCLGCLMGWPEPEPGEPYDLELHTAQQRAKAEPGVIEVGVYLHKKGGKYRVLHVDATWEETLKPAVVYMSLTDGRVWVRPAASWLEPVRWPDGSIRPRFARWGS